MSIKATEVGKIVRCATGFDLSSKTTLEVTITDADGTEVLVGDGNITLDVGYTDPTLGEITANEYAQFSTTALHFPSAGSYSLYVTYTTATETYYSDAATISIGAIGS